MKKYCFGVDVGGTTVKVGLFTVEGQLLISGRLLQEQKIMVKIFYLIYVNH